MKTLKIVLIACLLGISFFSNAQLGETFRFGLTFSPMISWLKPEGANVSSEKIRFGFSYGLLSEIGFAENYAISTGFFVTHNGGKLLFSNDSIDLSTSKHKLQYLEIPALFKLKTNEIGYMTYFGQIGITPAFRIKARSDVENKVTGETLEDINTVDATRIFNLYLTVGAGLEYSLTDKTSLIVSLFYKNGLINTLKSDDDSKAFVNNLGVLVGVMF